MKFLVSVTLLLTLGSCVDVWTPFLNEVGEEYDANMFGVEFADNWSAAKGGNGGGAWTEDCGCNGIEQISMECGKYVGMLKVKCGGRWRGEHGLGKANGHGAHYTIDARSITKVDIRAGAYVDKMIFYGAGGRILRTCGSSNGGGRYSATAPAGMILCGLSGRSGWWMDKAKAGWCYKKTDCQVGNFGAWGRCSNYKQRRDRQVTQQARCGGRACPSNVHEERCCEMNGHRCQRGHQHQCCGTRCCSQWGWCGGSRDRRWDAYCGHSLEFLNHVAGFHSEVGDISVAFTGVFAAVIFLPTFAVYKFLSRQSERADYDALLNQV